MSSVTTRYAWTRNTDKRLSSHALHRTLYYETPPTWLWETSLCTTTNRHFFRYLAHGSACSVILKPRFSDPVEIPVVNH
jgi:hypothetical protein